MSDLNFDENTINRIKNMMNNGELNDVISQISPEMIQNFSSSINKSKSSDNESSAKSTNTSNNSDFSNIDINTILKMKSVMDSINNKDDARSNLLNSLKPYLRDSRKEKIDQYANLLNFAKIAELLRNDNKEKPNA